MDPKSIVIWISLTKRNSRPIDATFDGYAYLDAGFLAGAIPLSNTLSQHDATLLSAFTLTGCPIAARTSERNLNPWVATGGAYTATRLLESATFRAESAIVANPRGSAIEMSLDVRVDGQLPTIDGIKEPFQEKIQHREKGKLLGEFDLTFTDIAGHEYIARAITNYRLPIDFDANTVWRNITILGFTQSGAYKQIEQIDLFSNVEVATSDLVDKRGVFKDQRAISKSRPLGHSP